LNEFVQTMLIILSGLTSFMNKIEHGQPLLLLSRKPVNLLYK